LSPRSAGDTDRAISVGNIRGRITSLPFFRPKTEERTAIPVFSELTQYFAAIQRLINEVQGHGCVIKDLNVGLLDFLAERNGREVYLCWRFGEDKIEYFHELHTGFQGRKRF
jgi:hypothetical protein